jgi:two-component system LytT family response regulator
MQDFFFVHDNKQYLQILFSEIKYIEKIKRYIKIFTASTPHLVPVSLNYAEAKLPAHLFCRIHKSYIISLKHTKAFDSENVLVAGKTLPLGKHYKGLFQQKVSIWGSDFINPELSNKTIDSIIEKS